MRTMEIQAYQASIVFRDWEDSCKGTIYYEHLQKGDNKMSTKDWKNKELTTLLSEAWGFKFNTLEEFDEFNGKGELQAEETEVQEEAAEVEAETEINEEEQLDEMHCNKGAGNRDCNCPKCAKKQQNEADENDGETLEEEEDIEEGKEEKKHPLDVDGDGGPPDKDDFKALRQGKKPTKEEIETIVDKVIKEVIQKRKG